MPVMMPARSRRGVGLLEVIIALPLISLLGAVAVLLLVHVHRRVLETDGTLAASRELRHAAAALTAEWRGLRARDIVAWSDSAVEFDATVGVGMVCALSTPTQLDIVAAANDDALSVVWNQSPQDGDRVLAWHAGRAPDAAPEPMEGTLRTTGASTSCSGSPLTAPVAATATRITLSDTLGWRTQPGSPVRITRRTRYSIYRASDGDWYLGRRTRGATGWDVVQPVAGPLLSFAQRGLRFTARDRADAPLSPTDSVERIARLNVALRAPRKTGRAAAAGLSADSLQVGVALRGNRSGAP
jgi:hypothetical protein